MKKRYFTIFLLSLFAIVTNLFADNDTITYVEYYSCNFEDSLQNNQWQIKASSGKNKWIINRYDGDNTCLYISENNKDSTYAKKSSSISLVYKIISISADDSLQIEFDANIGGESNNDFVKVMIVPNDFNLTLPNLTSTNLGFVGPYYKDSCFIFDNDRAYISHTNGWQHFTSTIKNHVVCSDAKLIFIWRNDNSVGDDIAAIIDNITIKGIPTIIEQSICEADTLHFYTQKLTETGLYCEKILSENNCDSIIYLKLNINPVVSSFKDTIICDNQAFYLSNGQQINTPGIYFDTLKNENYCDSIVTYNLSINPTNVPIDTNNIINICQNATYSFADKELSESGLYFDTLSNIFSCDSIVTLQLIINPIYQIDTTICINSNEIYCIGEHIYNQEGVYIDTLTTTEGCDSVITTNLKIISSLNNEDKYQEIKIFPNPIRDKLYVILQLSANKRVISLINELGITVKTIEVPANQKETSINVENLNKGIYLLRIVDNNSSLEKSIIIQ